jgi:DNA-binding transcriptional MocR family regulator
MHISQLAIPASVHLNPEDVNLMNGCGMVVESLFHVFCDPNDTILIPSPYYGDSISLEPGTHQGPMRLQKLVFDPFLHKIR